MTWLWHILGYLTTAGAFFGVGWFAHSARHSRDGERATRVLILDKERRVQETNAEKQEATEEIEEAFHKPGWEADLAGELGIDTSDPRYRNDNSNGS